jgi:hypothetical protein
MIDVFGPGIYQVLSLSSFTSPVGNRLNTS